MFRTVRDAAPAVLVPLAWLVVDAAHRGLVGTDAVFVAHLVMAAFVAVFAITGWSAMGRGALRAWRAVLVAGLGVTLAGIAGFRLSSEPLLTVSVVGWMVLPTAGLAYTGRAFPAARLPYYVSAALSGLGAVVYVTTLVRSGLLPSSVGIALVGVGQTIGMVDAVLRSR
ncbi:hypothetical protein [Halorientalis litorea]|uniref:hypothetical protein n=1 Tax=Halorientalis litorea TaxID=2931977 RepID=UPI001FF1ABE5|nr:hypothetical protein [Halorientalis litorea]